MQFMIKPLSNHKNVYLMLQVESVVSKITKSSFVIIMIRTVSPILLLLRVSSGKQRHMFSRARLRSSAHLADLFALYTHSQVQMMNTYAYPQKNTLSHTYPNTRTKTRIHNNRLIDNAIERNKIS